MSNEHPIIFKGEMVRAILEGRKTQTRRIVLADVPESMDQALHVGVGSFEAVRSSGLFRFSENKTGEMWPNGPLFCPYGKPGDRLWVRERTEEDVVGSVSIAKYSADGSQVVSAEGGYPEWWYSRKSCPSIHMPRWASRITLEITDVRVERLCDITESDAEAEGVEEEWRNGEVHGSAKDVFSSLWDSINGDGSWLSNPWVWVIEFKRIDQEAKAA